MKRCIIFDIDGTLANLEHRKHFVTSRKKDWANFDALMHLDTPIKQMMYMNTIITHYESVHPIGSDLRMPIFCCSGRSEPTRVVTENWLNCNGVCYDELFMRPDKDYRADHIVKKEMLEKIRALGYEPWLIFDDRPSVVSMWRKEGLFVLQCDPDPSDTMHDVYEFHELYTHPLIIMVGPSGAGKTSIIPNTYPTHDVISSDKIRLQLCGDFKDQTQNERVFKIMHDMAQQKLQAGIPVVLDATHLRNVDRIKAAKLLPACIPVHYYVLNRPLKEKIADGGWRNGISIKGKPLIEFHDQVFNSNLKDILNGDDLPNVTVFDDRRF